MENAVSTTGKKWGEAGILLLFGMFLCLLCLVFWGGAYKKKEGAVRELGWLYEKIYGCTAEGTGAKLTEIDGQPAIVMQPEELDTGQILTRILQYMGESEDKTGYQYWQYESLIDHSMIGDGHIATNNRYLVEKKSGLVYRFNWETGEYNIPLTDVN